MLLILGCDESPKKESIKPIDKSEIIKQQSPRTIEIIRGQMMNIFEEWSDDNSGMSGMSWEDKEDLDKESLFIGSVGGATSKDYKGVNGGSGTGHKLIHQAIDKFFWTLRKQSYNESGYKLKAKFGGGFDEYGNLNDDIESYLSDLIIVDSLFYKEVNKFSSYPSNIKLINVLGIWTADDYRYGGIPKGAALFRQVEKYLGVDKIHENIHKYWNLEKPLDTVYLKLPENYYDIK